MGQETVGGVGQSVEVQQAREPQVGRHHHGGRDRRVPHLGGPQPDAPERESEQRPDDREPEQGAPGRPRGPADGGEERQGPAHHARSRGRTRPATTSSTSSATAATMRLSAPRSSRNWRPISLLGCTPSPTSSLTTTVSPGRAAMSAQSRTPSAANEATPASQTPSESTSAVPGSGPSTAPRSSPGPTSTVDQL